MLIYPGFSGQEVKAYDIFYRSTFPNRDLSPSRHIITSLSYTCHAKTNTLSSPLLSSDSGASLSLGLSTLIAHPAGCLPGTLPPLWIWNWTCPDSRIRCQLCLWRTTLAYLTGLLPRRIGERHTRDVLNPQHSMHDSRSQEFSCYISTLTLSTDGTFLRVTPFRKSRSVRHPNKESLSQPWRML